MKTGEIQLVDEFMVPIELAQFIDGTQLPSDVFFKLKANKYVHVGKNGQACHLRDLHLFEGNKNHTVFVHRGEFKNFVNQSLARLEAAEASGVGLDDKIIFLSQSAELVIKKIQYIGLTQEAYDGARKLSKSIRSLSRLSTSILDLVYRLKTLPGDYINHSMCVSALSSMIGVELGWTSEVVLENLSTGSLLHDIGLLSLPSELLRKSYVDMTPAEKELYETHPYLGAQALRKLPSVPSEAITIVYEHHERSTGEGFPRRVGDDKINPLSKVAGLADQFTELIMPTTNESPLKPEQALNYIENVLGQPFNVQYYKAFKSIFGNF